MRNNQTSMTAIGCAIASAVVKPGNGDPSV